MITVYNATKWYGKIFERIFERDATNEHSRCGKRQTESHQVKKPAKLLPRIFCVSANSDHSMNSHYHDFEWSIGIEKKLFSMADLKKSK